MRYTPASDWPRPWHRKRGNAAQQFKPQPLPLMADLRAAVFDALADGWPVPCVGRSEWTSEDREVRARAARLCSCCPIRRECAEAAEEHDERFGVWGGRDLTPVPRGRSGGRRPRTSTTTPAPAPAPQPSGTTTRRSSGTN